MQWQRYLERRAPPAARGNEPETFDADRFTEEIGKLAEEAGAAQVPGGWEIVKGKQPEEWRRMVTAFIAVDDAFSRRDERGVMGAIAKARRALMTVRFS